jgi:hypothetical protein
MESSRWRARIRASAIVLGLLAALGGCASQAPKPAPAFEAGVALPLGPGREILVASCLVCHDLGGLALFKGFYTRDSWRDLVLTMRENGADVDGAETEVLADYLEQHFGPQTR